MNISLKKESRLLAKHSMIYGLGNLLNRVAALLLLPVYTRFLTPHDYGIKELVGLSTDVIGILLATAISGAIYRFYFEYEDVKIVMRLSAQRLLLLDALAFWHYFLFLLVQEVWPSISWIRRISIIFF